MAEKKKIQKATSALHEGQSPQQWAHQAIIPPIYLTTNFAQPVPGVSDYEYSRSSNPTRNVLEQALAATESANYGLAFSSGLGALTTISHLLKPGTHVLCCDDVYGGAYRFFKECLPKQGKSCTFVDGTTVESWTNNFMIDKTKLVWIESPTNPTMKIVDIRNVARVLKKLDEQCIVVVDNTFMSPVLQSPLSMGADIVMHSCTKYINGHSDVIMGCIMTNNTKIYKEMRYLQNALGIVPSPFDCSLVIRSIKTLQIRVKHQSEVALKIAKYLEQSEYIDQVLYPGLESHPQHELAKKECCGFGGMISIKLKTINGDEGLKLVDSVKIFHCAVSLGCVSSLIQIPSLMTHTAVDEEKRLELGMTNNLVRLSVGLEECDDLIDDLEQAIRTTYENVNNISGNE